MVAHSHLSERTNQVNKTMQAIADAVREKRDFTRNGYSIERGGRTTMYNVFERDGTVQVSYRGTQVAFVMADRNRIFLNTGGYRTVTTKRVINAVLAGAGANASVFQEKGKWAIRRMSRYAPFETLNVCVFDAFDKFALPLAIDGVGTLTESEKLFNA